MTGEDLSLFLDQDDFAQTVTIAGEAVTVIVDDQYVEVNTGRAPYSAIRTTLTGKEEDFTAGAAVVIGSANYTIVDIQPDGVGMAIAVLEKA